MSNRYRFTALFIALIMCVLTGCAGTKVTTQEEQDLKLRDIRVGCFNSGEYYYYHDILDSIALELQRTGYISGYDPDKTRETTKDVWLDLCACKSEYFHFIPEVYYEKYSMTDEELEVATKEDGVDLMIAVGSMSGLFLTERADEINYDYMVIGVADPISGGMVKSATERLNDRSFVVVDTKRITRQIEAAYEMFHFKDIGVVYDDTPEAYSYSGIGQLKDAAERYGFNIHERHVKEAYELDYDRYYPELKAAYDELLPEIDLLYITTATIEDDKLPWLLEDMTEAGIITVAETSESQVEYGAMMHITMSDAYEEGQFVAARIVEYASGADITDMDMVFEIAPKICLNRTTIERVGAQIPLETYLVADKIYE
ncbi:MAG: hypothetical protein K6E68_00420 [Lachnospiraceae bacterium]|nr:hypothetical protein [Lachnospiraceae bacterium]